MAVNGNLSKIIAAVVGIVLLIVTAITSTLVIERTRERDTSQTQVERIVLILDAMKLVDTDLAAQIAEVRGVNTTAIALINQRITTVTDMLSEIKGLLRGK